MAVPWQQQGHQSYMEYLAQQRISDKQIQESLSTAANRNQAFVSNLTALDDPRIGNQMRLAQYQARAAALREINHQTWQEIEQQIRTGMFNAGQVGVRAQGELAELLVRSGMPGRDAAVLARSMSSAAISSAEVARASMMSRIDLSSRVWNNMSLADGRIDRIVTSGILMGQSARELAEQVYTFVDPATPGGMSYAAMRLARTEINNAFHATSALANARNPFVTGVKWELSGSHPQPDECDEFAEDDHDNLGAGIYNPMNVPGKPHPHCLCFTVTVTPEPEQVVDQLLAGEYDDWLMENGQMPLGVGGVGVPTSLTEQYKEFGPDEMRESMEWGEQNITDPMSLNLSLDEVEALHDYKMLGFEDVNSVLRGHQASDSLSESLISSIDSAISRSTVNQNVVLHRGMPTPGDSALQRAFEQGNIIGTRITDRAYLSTSLNPKVTNGFIGTAREDISRARQIINKVETAPIPGTNVAQVRTAQQRAINEAQKAALRIEIQTSGGTNAFWLEHFAEGGLIEAEALLPRGTTLEVTGTRIAEDGIRTLIAKIVR